MVEEITKFDVSIKHSEYSQSYELKRLLKTLKGCDIHQDILIHKKSIPIERKPTPLGTVTFKGKKQCRVPQAPIHCHEVKGNLWSCHKDFRNPEDSLHALIEHALCDFLHISLCKPAKNF